MIIETAYQYLFTGAMVLLILLIGIMLVRAVIGPRITDRILSINMIGTMVISCILVLAVWLREDFLTDVAIIYAMISFLAVLMLAATYIPSHAARGAFGEDGQEKSTSREEVCGADGTGAENGVFRQVPEASGEGVTENGSTGKNADTQGAGSAGKAGVSKNSSGAKGKSAGSTGTAGVPKSSSGAKRKSAGSAGKSAARKSDSDVKEKAAGSAGTARMRKSDSGAKGKSAARKNSSGAKGSAGRKSQGGRKK